MKEALKLALEAFTIVRFCVPPAQRPTIERAITTTIEALAQPEQEPVAYLVTGPYEKTAFSDIDSANAYCRGLNKGFGADAYIVSPLYTTPPQRKPLTDEHVTDGSKCWCDPELDYKDPDTGVQVWIHRGKQ